MKKAAIKKKCIVGMAIGMTLIPGLGSASETVSYDGTTPALQTIGGMSNVLAPLSSLLGNQVIVHYDGTDVNYVFGAYTGGFSTTSNNSVSLESGEWTNNISNDVYGAFSQRGGVSSNIVDIGQGAVGGDVYGGASEDGSVSSNTVTIDMGTVGGNVYGGKSTSGGAGYSQVTIGQGVVTGVVYGSWSSSGAVAHNQVTLNDNGQADQLIGGYSHSGTVNANIVTMSDGTVTKVYGGYNDNTINLGAVHDNQVNIGGGTVTSDAYGGFSENTNVYNNAVNLTDGLVQNNVYGGYSTNGTVDSNQVTIGVATVSGNVYGGWTNLGQVTNNSVLVNDAGTVASGIYGGYSYNTGASGNTVEIRAGSVHAAFGGGSGLNGVVSNNHVIVSGNSTVDYIYGGTTGGSASNNTVEISGGTVGQQVYGGKGRDANRNSITISGGTISGTVRGGVANGGGATGNSITISGTADLTNATLYGGYRETGAGDVITGNTLNIKNSDLRARGIANFQNYNFYLPTTLAQGGTMLTVTNTADISNSSISVGINGGTTALRPGERVTLLSTGGLTAAGINTRALGLQGIARIYDFDLSTDANNLYATVAESNADSGVLNPQVKALSEGQLAAITFVNQGGDIVVGQGLANARSTTAGTGQTSGFAVMSGNSLCGDTGSHINVRGLSLLAGAAKQKSTDNGNVVNGLFVETGWGSYNTYNDFVNASSVRGDGNTSYFGAGWLGRWQKNGGQYLESSLRIGRVTNEFSSNDFAVEGGTAYNGSYDVSVPYYGMHIGFGKEKDLGNGCKMDVYTKLLYTRQNGSHAIVQSDIFDFESINSYRWQLGTKWLRKTDEGTTVRSGIAYQYEFGGEANATVNGAAIAAPSLKGSSGIVELGLSKKREGVTWDFGLQGFFGKVRGMVGNIRAIWDF